MRRGRTAVAERRAFTLLELVVAIGVLVLVGIGVLTLLSTAVAAVRDARLRTLAVGVATERIERARNLPYGAVGTVGGIPSGPFAPEESMTVAGVPFTIRTTIRYVDDPADGVAPADAVPSDYKHLSLEVAWRPERGVRFRRSQSVQLATIIAPPGLEPALAGGTLRLRVHDATGTPVPDALVRVTSIDDAISPPVTLELPSDARGEVLLPGAPIGEEAYAVAVSKVGFSMDGTLAPSTENPTPSKPPLTVLRGQVTDASFAIDRTSDLTTQFVHPNSRLVTDTVTFTLRGTRRVGSRSNPAPPPDDLPVYAFPERTATTSTGTAAFVRLAWDTYVLMETTDAYDFAGSIPALPLDVLPGTTPTLTVTLARHHAHTLLAQVRDPAGAPVADARVTVAPAVEQPLEEDIRRGTTTASGEFFASPLQDRSYTVTVERTGFTTRTETVDVRGQTTHGVRLERL